MFEPTFDIVDYSNIAHYQASLAINEVHENGKEKFDPTARLIRELIESGTDMLTAHDLHNIHARLFPELGPDAGRYRKCEVIVGNDAPPSPNYLLELMAELGPISVNTPDLTNWYQQFQTIHPYKDGNGRVGGVALAVISMLKCGFIIVPKGV